MYSNFYNINYLFFIEKVFPNDFIAEPVVHIPSEELQSGTSIVSENSSQIQDELDEEPGSLL